MNALIWLARIGLYLGLFVGVGGVFFGADFITVTKSTGEWPQLKPAILGAIMEHFMSGAPVVASDVDHGDSGADEFFEAGD